VNRHKIQYPGMQKKTKLLFQINSALPNSEDRMPMSVPAPREVANQEAALAMRERLADQQTTFAGPHRHYYEPIETGQYAGIREAPLPGRQTLQALDSTNFRGHLPLNRGMIPDGYVRPRDAEMNAVSVSTEIRKNRKTDEFSAAT
jgi:hypothetical protein